MTSRPSLRSTANGWSLLLAAVLLATSGTVDPAFAQGRAPVRFTVRLEPEKVPPGGTVEAVATYETDADWHIYAPDFDGTGTPTKLEESSPSLEPAGDAKFPEPKLVEIPELGETQRLLEGKGSIRRSFRLADDAKPGETIGLTFLLTYQACTSTTCLVPVKDAKYEVSLEVADAGEAGSSAPAEDVPEASENAAPADGAGELLVPGLLPLPSGAAGSAGRSPGTPSTNPVRFSIEFESPRAAPGGTVDVLARYEVEGDYHIYAPDFDGTGTPTRIEVPEGKLAAVGPPRFPDPKLVRMEALGETQRLLEGKGTIRQTFRLSPSAVPGSAVDVPVVVHYQACTDTTCLVPTKAEKTLQIDVAGAVGAPAPPGDARADPPGSSAVEEGSIEPGESERTQGEGTARGAPAGGTLGELGIWGFLGLIIAGGIFTLFMPCTYPMIPLTISFFTKQADVRKGSVLTLAFVYGLGIILSFVLIGLVVAFGLLTAQGIQSFASNPWVNFVFACLFVLFALVLVGVFTPRLPTGLSAITSRAMGSGGYLGVFGLGATLCITSFTCTAPIMGSLLLLAARGGDGSVARVVLGMAVFGATVALPFVVLAIAPGRLSSLPRAGEWMNTIKVSLGLLELAAALKFFSTADLVWAQSRERALDGSLALWLPRDVFLILWSAMAAVAALVLLGIVRLHGSSGDTGPGRLLVGAGCLFFSVYFGFAALGHPLPAAIDSLPPPAPEATRAEIGTGAFLPGAAEERDESAGGIIITRSWERGLGAARREGRLVLADFTGPTCVVCRTMEEQVFPQLSDVLSQVVQTRLDTDPNPLQEENLRLQTKLVGVDARPSYALVDPKEPDRAISTFLLPTTAKTVTLMGRAFREWLGGLLEERAGDR